VIVLTTSRAKKKTNTMAMNDRQGTHYAHMAFEEVSDATSTAPPYGGDDFSKLYHRYETEEFVHEFPGTFLHKLHPCMPP
jgi:hypothetical protein